MSGGYNSFYNFIVLLDTLCEMCLSLLIVTAHDGGGGDGSVSNICCIHEQVFEVFFLGGWQVLRVFLFLLSCLCNCVDIYKTGSDLVIGVCMEF